MIIEGFAGPGGWSQALRELGQDDALGIEWDETACATAMAAGHKRLQADVSMVDLRDYPDVRGLIMSPPCQSYSAAGKQLGKLDRPRIEAHVARVAAAGRWLHYSREGWHDPRSPLVLEPLRYALGLRPEWIALEQVPLVLPLWQAIGEVLRGVGYETAVGILTAEQYGVPQTRKRAFLIASTNEFVTLPTPTHRKYKKGVAQHEGDPTLLPWVSMAQALGCSGAVMRSNYGTGGDPAARGERASDEPAPTITGKIDRNLWMNGAGASNYTVDPRPVDAPSQTITGKGTAEWMDREYRASTMPRASRRALGEPAPTITFGHDAASATWGDKTATSRVSVTEAAVLQTFPADYPWQGTKTAQYRQIGDAVPPLLAKAVLEAVIR